MLSPHRLVDEIGWRFDQRRLAGARDCPATKVRYPRPLSEVERILDLRLELSRGELDDLDDER